MLQAKKGGLILPAVNPIIPPSRLGGDAGVLLLSMGVLGAVAPAAGSKMHAGCTAIASAVRCLQCDIVDARHLAFDPG